MPRYYRRRFPRRIFRKRNWSSNILTSETTISFPVSSTYGGGSAICLNPVQSVSTVSQPFTVKNIKLSISANSATTAGVYRIDQLVAALVYVPQGYTVTYSTLNEHPEWFMAVKFLDNPQVDDPNTSNIGYLQKPFTISTRLARKLQTGDSVQLCLFGTNKSDQVVPIRFSFMAQWWTCAN